MSLTEHPRAYGTAAVALAFGIGVMVTLGFKDLYPDLEWRYQTKMRRVRQARTSKRRSSASAVGDGSAPGRRVSFNGPVLLEDHESNSVDSVSLISAAPPPGGRVASDLAGLVGNTPLLRLGSLSDATGCEIFAKCEHLNAVGGSPKDRVAVALVEAGEAAGLLVPGRPGPDTIYEGTVGSTGISLAALARAKGYACHIVMPDDQSMEKVELLRHLGATVERVPVAPIADPGHYVNVARRRAAEHAEKKGDGSMGYFADQFENEANWHAHFASTGPEIVAQTGGRIDCFVAGAGTGGTISGVARYLRTTAASPPSSGVDSDDDDDGHPRASDLATRLSPPSRPVRVVLADPQGSGLYHRVKHGVMFAGATEREGKRRRAQVDSLVEGLGVNRVTANFEAGRELIDDAVRVTDDQALTMARWLVEHEGVFVGSSSAVNCVAAVVAALQLPKGSVVVTVLCDGGARHLSKFWKAIAERRTEAGDGGGKEVEQNGLAVADGNGKKDERQGKEEELLKMLGLEDLARLP